MMNRRQRFQSFAGALLGAAAVALSGCGDSGYRDTPAPPTSDVPTAALASPAALVSWASGLAASDTALPLNVNDVALPTSDTIEPAALSPP